MTLTPITEFDVIFISYDEPNADDNWYDLLDKCPWAKRSHGVYGSDAAHKAAAALSETQRFITIDADNIVDAEFFNIELDMSKIGKNDVMSWAAKNEINGLVYGNGGIKCWPKHVVEQMRTHEAAPANNLSAQVDFCWNINYIQMHNCYSHVYNNASPLQAWRAGFREGCKMTLNNGNVIDKSDMQNIHPENYKRLLVWQSVGQDTLNGIWAIYGARLGCVMTNLRREQWDWRNVRDFKWLNEYWDKTIAPTFALPDSFEAGVLCVKTGYNWYEALLQDESRTLGLLLKDEFNLEITDLSIEGSTFFKTVYTNNVSDNAMLRENEGTNTT